MISINEVQFTVNERNLLNDISTTYNSGDSYHYLAYQKLDQVINIDKFNVHKKCKKNDMIEFINPNLSHWTLGYFNKAFNVDMYVNIKKACKSGKLPFYCFSKLGKDATDMIEDKKKGNTYSSKITSNQIAELDKLIKDNRKLSGTVFNDKIDSFLPAKKKAKTKTEFQKALNEVKSLKARITKGKFTVNQKLQLDSFLSAIAALVVVTKSERQGVVQKVKKAA